MKAMSNEHHTTPIFSVISGVFGGVYAFIQNNGFIVENFLELIKVIVFGVIGGAFGYVGKYLAEKFLKGLKERSKDMCK